MSGWEYSKIDETYNIFSFSYTQMHISFYKYKLFTKYELQKGRASYANKVEL